MEKEDDVTLTAWTHNNFWNQQDFKSCTWGDQPTFAAAKGGPECDFLLNAWNLKSQPGIKKQLEEKIQDLEERRQQGEEEIWMYLDSGASRSVIQEESPIKALLTDVSETNGSCNVGNGANLKYLKKGMLNSNNEVTVVQGLKYDLYACGSRKKRSIMRTGL